MLDQIEKSWRGGCAIGIDVADEVGSRSEFEAFDQRAAFADGSGIIQNADFGKFGVNLVDDADGVVAAAIGDDEKLERRRCSLRENIGRIPAKRARSGVLRCTPESAIARWGILDSP